MKSATKQWKDAAAARTAAGLGASDTPIFAGLDMSGSGKGVKLPSTPGNADANTLDCYVESNWTPTLQAATNPTISAYDANTGKYTAKGNVLDFDIYVRILSGSFSGGSGQLKINLPSTPSVNTICQMRSSNITFAANTTFPYALLYTDGYAYLFTGGSGVSEEVIPCTAWPTAANAFVHLKGSFFR
jgi:hypothetical protein